MVRVADEYKVTGIYRISSLVHPDRCYIGSAVVIWERWSEHKRLLRLQKHTSPVLQCHFNKYGIDDLVFTVIECCEKTLLVQREQFYIDTDSFKGYFNVCKTAGNCLGTKQSDETRKKRSDAQKGRKLAPRSKEHCLAISIAKTGKKMKNPSPLKGRKVGKRKTPLNWTEEGLARLKQPKTEEHKSAVKKSWIKRKEEGKVGERDDLGRYIRKIALP